MVWLPTPDAVVALLTLIDRHVIDFRGLFPVVYSEGSWRVHGDKDQQMIPPYL